MNNNLGNFIYYLRKKKNISQEELASTLNVSVTAVSKWERGVCNPRNSKMKDIAQILGVSVKELEEGKIKEKKRFDYLYIIIILLIILSIILLGLLIFKQNHYYKIYALNDKYAGSGFIYTNNNYEELYIHSLSIIEPNIKGYVFSYTILFDDITLLKNGNINDYEENAKLISLNEYISSIDIYYKSEFSSFLNERKSNLDKYNIRIVIDYINEEEVLKTYEIELDIFDN